MSMKKLFSVLLSTVLMLCACSWAAAESAPFDRSVFDDASFYTFSESKNRIEMANPAACLFDPGLSQTYNCSFAPQIQLSDGGARPELRLDFFSDRALTLKSMTFRFLDAIYNVSFSPVSSEALENGEFHTAVTFPLEDSAANFAQHLSAEASPECTVLLRADGQLFEFALTDGIAEAISRMYADFVKANSADAEAEFDPSLFPADLYEAAEEDGSFSVELMTYDECIFDPGYSDLYYSIFAPLIVGSDGTPTFCLWGKLYTDEPYNRQIVFEIGEKYYTLENFDTDLEDSEESLIVQSFSVEIGETLRPLLEALEEYADSPISLSFVGENGSYSFTMSDSMKKNILDTYRLFIQAGGTFGAPSASDCTLTITDREVISVSDGVQPQKEVLSFDLTVFGDAYTVTEANERQYGYVDLADRSPTYLDSDLSDAYYSCFTPDICLADESNFFRLWSYFYAKTDLQFDTAVLTFPQHTYTVEGIYDNARERDNGDIRQFLSIRIGSGLSQMMEEMRGSDSVHVELIGPSERYAFEMTEDMKSEILNMYDLYLEAGGEQFLESVEENSFTVAETVPMPVPTECPATR